MAYSRAALGAVARFPHARRRPAGLGEIACAHPGTPRVRATICAQAHAAVKHGATPSRFSLAALPPARAVVGWAQATVMTEPVPVAPPCRRAVYDRVTVALLAALALNVYFYYLAKPALKADPIFDFPAYYYSYRSWAGGASPYHSDNINAAARRDGYTHHLYFFLYPPITLLLFAPICGPLDYANAYRAWLVLSHLALLGAVALLIRLRGGPLRALPNALLAAAALAYWPYHLTCELGQINVFFLLTLVAGFYAHARAWHPALVALFFILGACIKVISVIFLPLFLLRREWRIFGYCCVWAVAAFLIQGLGMGWELLWEFRAMLADFSGRRYDALTNISLKGCLWRLVNAGYLPAADDEAVARGLYALLALLFAGGCLYTLWKRRRAVPALQGGLVLTTFFLLSTPTWIHHLTLLVFVYGTVIDAALRPDCPRGLFLALAASYLLTGLYWGQYQLEPYAWTAPLQSMATYGLLALYGALTALLWRHGEEWTGPTVPRAAVGEWA